MLYASGNDQRDESSKAQISLGLVIFNLYCDLLSCVAFI